MIIVGLSDIHGDTALLEAIGEQLARASVVIVSGDLTHFGGRAEASQVIAAIQAHNQRVLTVPGNCDTPAVGEFLTRRQINLDRKSIVLDGVSFAGIGGSLPCPGQTPNERPEEQFAESLEELTGSIRPDQPSVFVTHQPPYGTTADLAGTARHVGSKSVRDFITQTQPLLCLCGHIHESRGTDRIGRTTVLNPGPLRFGYYVYAELDGQSLVAKICRVGD
jgi:hypothetical protein